MKKVMEVSIKRKFLKGEYVIGLKFVVKESDGHVCYIENENIYLDKIDENTEALILEAVASNVLRSKRKNDFYLEKVVLKSFDKDGSYQEKEILL